MPATDNLPVKTALTIKDLLNSDIIQDKLSKILPASIPPSKVASAVLLIIDKSRNLQECSPNSLLRCVMQGAELGLSFSLVLGQAYLVPFKGEATFIVGYRGLINLALRNNNLASIEAHPVFVDDFTIGPEFGLTPKFVHRPKWGSPNRGEGDVIAVYAVARLRGGDGQFMDYMTRDEVVAIRERSPGKNADPWKLHWIEMAKKTVLRRLLKTLPMRGEDPLAQGLDADSDFQADLTPKDVTPRASLESRMAEAEKMETIIDEMPSEYAREQPPQSTEPPQEAVGTGAPPRYEQLIVLMSEVSGRPVTQCADKVTNTAKALWKTTPGNLTSEQLDSLEAMIRKEGLAPA